MLKQNSELWLRLGVGAFLIAISALVLSNSNTDAPTTLDSLGPSAFPRALSIIVIGLSLVYMARTIVALLNADVEAERKAPLGYQPQVGLALGLATLTLIYVIAFGFGFLSFRWATIAFLTASGLLLTRFNLLHVPYVIATALIMGFGVHYVFTQILVVALP